MRLIHFLIVGACLFTVNKSTAQIAEAELIGSWRPMKFHVADDPQYPEASNPEMFKMFSQAFKNGVFTFNPDYTCSIVLPAQPDLGAPKAFWKWDPEKSIIHVAGTKSSAQKLSGDLYILFAKRQQGKMLWLIHETPIILEMEKQPTKSRPQPIKVSK